MSQSITIEEAIKIATQLLMVGSSPHIIQAILVKDGFNPEKASVVVRWAQRNLNQEIIPAAARPPCTRCLGSGSIKVTSGKGGFVIKQSDWTCPRCHGTKVEP